MTEGVVQDRGAALVEGYRWRLVGTGVEGAALLRMKDDGMQFEELADFRTPSPLRR